MIETLMVICAVQTAVLLVLMLSAALRRHEDRSAHMIETLMVICAVQTAVLLVLMLSAALRRRRPSTLAVGQPLTPLDVEQLAIRRSDDPDIVALCADWTRQRRRKGGGE